MGPRHDELTSSPSARASELHGLGSQSYTSRRRVSLGSISSVSTSSHDGDSVAGVLSVGLFRKAGRFEFDPFASLYYTSVKNLSAADAKAKCS